jgi:superfamily I DNA and/or RNA helicase
MLMVQYRMHEQIMEFSSEQLYDGQPTPTTPYAPPGLMPTT